DVYKRQVHDQLVSEAGEQFSEEAANYAMENVEADWEENALAKAKSYQDDMDMSPESIRDQLSSEAGEQFTADEANYALEHLNTTTY
ncbi:Ltp family lipoprotein, partial [Latilactobacillus sakei]|uniref:Ltp family lipoprotein n=1 Tax=Latilactobacillus sakei TaxID=1599 RepID=UPI0018E99283